MESRLWLASAHGASDVDFLQYVERQCFDYFSITVLPINNGFRKDCSVVDWSLCSGGFRNYERGEGVAESEVPDISLYGHRQLSNYWNML